MASNADLPQATHAGGDGSVLAAHGGSLNHTAAMATGHCLVEREPGSIALQELMAERATGSPARIGPTKGEKR